MTIEMLREFQVLATYLNFTYASNILYETQPTLSKHIVQLEEELQQTMFIRTKKGVSLTYAGQIFLDSVIQMLKVYDESVSDIAALNRPQTGSLSISFNMYAMDSMLSPMTAAMAQQYPEIQLNLSCPMPRDPIDLVMKDEVDIAESYLLPFAGSEMLNFQPIGSIHFSLAVPSYHSLASKNSVDLRDVISETFVFTKAYPIFNRFLKNYLHAHDLTPSSVLTVSNPELMLYTVENTGSVAIISDAELDLNQQNTVFVPISNNDLYVTVAYAWKKNNKNPCISAFASMLKELYQISQ